MQAAAAANRSRSSSEDPADDLKKDINAKKVGENPESPLSSMNQAKLNAQEGDVVMAPEQSPYQKVRMVFVPK